MTNDDEKISIAEIYRGVGIHDAQSRDRIDRIVKPAIDAVIAMASVDELLEYCGDHGRPPEARLFAAAKIEAAMQIAADERRSRPEIDLVLVRARVAGLNSRTHRDPSAYGSLLDHPPPPGQPGAAPRPAEYRAMVEAARTR